MRIGVFGGDTAGRTLEQVIDDAKAAEAEGFAVYGLPQIFALDAMGVFAAVAQHVPRIEFATGVVPTYGRHPLTMAQQALTVQACSGNRFILGIGLSHQMVIENMFGLSFDKPVRHMREYLSVLMPLLHDGSVAFQGETISTAIGLGVADRVAPPVLVAALGTQMLNVAGRLADGTVTWMTGPATLGSHIVPTITAAAEKEGRPAPQISSAFPICLTDDLDGARERASDVFQVYGMLPSYRAMLDREGAEKPGDVALVGDEAALEKALRQIEDTGVTEFTAAFFGSREEIARTRAWLASQV
jgi:5,10-methylenetetrahydromethanopterin reductase